MQSQLIHILEINNFRYLFYTVKLVALNRFRINKLLRKAIYEYVARPQSKFPTRPAASKPYIARSDCAYLIEQCCSMAHALTVLPAFSQ
jgi:hypothetical protein